MIRRDLVALATAMSIAWPLPVGAQQVPMPVIGFLSVSSPEVSQPYVAAFRDGLEESGYVEGRTVTIQFKWAEGRHERLAALTAELLALRVAVIVASSSTAAVAARQVTQTVPIAFLSSDPVALGLVASLGRPGGNATGVNAYLAELVTKRLELLRELMPGARSVAFLLNPASATAASQHGDMQAAVRVMGFDLLVFEARTASEIDSAFARLAERRPDALIVAGDPLYLGQRERIVALAARHAIPAAYDLPDYAAVGGLFSYGPGVRDLLRLVGVYAGRILNGARPADLPVLQPTRFELVINLKAAKALGLVVPPTLLARADEVIE